LDFGCATGMLTLSIAKHAPASSTTKTGRHDIAEILLKVVLITKNQDQIIL